MFDFEYHLKNLPQSPGVYLMKNSNGEIIYVGKAKVLKNRVRQYFQSSKNHPEKVKQMVKNIKEFEYIVTDSEVEALILECNLIKKYSPRYNVLLKDDKHYPFIKITLQEEFPRVFVSRNFVNDGGKYFGPYPDGKAVYEVMELIRKNFPVRTCRKSISVDMEAIKECLNYHIGMCTAPCAKRITKAEYERIIEDIQDLLKGKNKSILKDLKEEMMKLSSELKFEEAAKCRDKINAVDRICEKQKIINGSFENEDFISVFSDESDSCVEIFFMRDGKIVGRENFIIDNTIEDNNSEVIKEFIKSFYSGTAYIPQRIFVQDISEKDILEEWLRIKAERKVEIKIPQIGEKKKVLQMVYKNAKETLETYKNKTKVDKELNKLALNELADALELQDYPERIEAYDISNIMGMDSVGCMVVFQNGKAKNSDYRRFKIKTVEGADDYSSMREILTRRFSRGLNEIKKITDNQIKVEEGKFSVFPDLIMMDGGKGQVNVAKEVLNELGIDIPVCGMVKDDKHRTRGLIFENYEVPISKRSNCMKLVTRIQDEVHRFAITYHKSLRTKRSLNSILEEIPNIGEKRRKELLLKFGSVENIKKATEKELLETPSINKKACDAIINYFKGNK
ncbi:excinuclease ABC subunit UvrC [Oceanirhabdus sp. W0125-5]|uniref:excinuclease ABC subunit UvrC n=1 Tax=Oceanirhabdus sp. W0125-5 TaxID=2999116 RepID=UPI0022F32357|nr:excinuclease ABC subunit UvrC [Oceanirhabdus sp. W0125-5]WBW99294.1 excinuclease ABC subunit UvrC [Oceanirhabdus sp. W0125-5]